MDRRHRGLTKPIADFYFEAACVCLSRHHSTSTQFTVTNQYDDQASETDYHVEWTSATDEMRHAWANDDDATENGAYAVVLAAIEEEFGLVAIHRAPTKTGCDYYLGTTGEEDDLDLENAVRLEISGVDHGPLSEVRARLVRKVNQAASVPSNLPAMAGVVGFSVRRVLLRNVPEL